MSESRWGHRCRWFHPMAQLMQPLAGVTDQPAAGWSISLVVPLKGSCQTRQALISTRWQWHSGRMGQLMMKQLIETLLASLKVVKPPIGLKGQ